MKFLRLLVRPTVASAVLEVIAFILLGSAVFHFLGFWWCLVFASAVLILIALAVDRRSK